MPGDLGGGGGCCGGSRVRPVGVVRQEASVEKADDRRVALAYPPPSKNTISHPKLDNFQGHKITRTVDMGRTFFTKVKHSLELHAFSKCYPPFFANFFRLSHIFCLCLVNFLSRFFSVCYDRIGMPGNSNQIIRPNPLFKFQGRLCGGGQKIC